MSKSAIDDHVLPRPAEKLPEFAHAKARRTLAERLVEAFGVSEEAANATANAVVDPTAVRKSIGEPTDPQVEEIPVPGGTLLGIRTHVWARRVMPDPRNPRIGPSRKHPFAVDPGSGGEDSKFRPVPEPRSPDSGPDEVPELVVDVESRHHLEWASGQAAKYVLSDNDWRASIASQGVMEAVWVVPTTYLHEDGSAPATALTTVEGSSRTTAVHSLLSIRSADVPYDEADQKLRTHVRKLNEALDRGASAEELVALRCERIPALVLIGFRRHPSGSTTFPTAVKSLVALRHVDPPKPWGEGPENESLADEVLDELYRRGVISATERSYFAGSCTKAEARAAHLSDKSARRAARIVELFTTDDPQTTEAIRVAVTSQSTRKRITSKLLNQLATALILRAVSGETARTDQIRRYMKHAFSKSVHREQWSSTDRETDDLVKEAHEEVKRWIGNDSAKDVGPASLELAVRASYPLVVGGRLNADRGTANNQQPDRRTPGEVLDAMRRTAQGVHQLGQAVRDFEDDVPIRAVEENGEIRKLSDGSGDQAVTDIFLREQFPPPGKVRARSGGKTPAEVFQNRMADLSDAMEKLEQAFDELGKVVGDDGRPLVEVSGADPRVCREWRELLSRIDEDLVFWGRTFSRVYGTRSEAPADEFDDDEDESPEVEINEAYDESYEAWDDDAETVKRTS